MRHDKFILDGHDVVAVDLDTWAKWCGGADRTVGKTTIGEADVSTVFLGLNHNWGDGPPLVFETMVFGGDHDEFQERCSTWEEAEEMHQRAIALVSK